MSLPAQHDNKNQGLQKSSVTSLGRSRIRPGKLGGNRGSGDNKVWEARLWEHFRTQARCPPLGQNAVSASLLSGFFCLAKEATLSLECRNVSVFFCVMTPGADNRTTKEGQCSQFIHLLTEKTSHIENPVSDVWKSPSISQGFCWSFERQVLEGLGVDAEDTAASSLPSKEGLPAQQLQQVWLYLPTSCKVPSHASVSGVSGLLQREVRTLWLCQQHSAVYLAKFSEHWWCV